MNKNELIASVAGSAGLSKADASKAVDSVFDSIGSALAGGGEVRLVGFGTFSVAKSGRVDGAEPADGRAHSHRGFKATQIQGR